MTSAEDLRPEPNQLIELRPDASQRNTKYGYEIDVP